MKILFDFALDSLPTSFGPFKTLSRAGAFKNVKVSSMHLFFQYEKLLDDFCSLESVGIVNEAAIDVIVDVEDNQVDIPQDRGRIFEQFVTKCGKEFMDVSGIDEASKTGQVALALIERVRMPDQAPKSFLYSNRFLMP